MVAQSLIVSNFDADAFRHDFAGRLRWWLASLPAGIGKATLRACVRLWFGVSPRSSGVFSAGNGPAMRSAIFGAVFDDIDVIVRFTRASARITHSDPKAEYGAIAIALATFYGRQDTAPDGQQFVASLAAIIGAGGDELVSLLGGVVGSVSADESTLDFAANNGHQWGVTGYTYHTVPVVIHAWLSNPRDYRSAVMSVIQCGGDADTTAAIVGGIVGSAVGEPGIPAQWVSAICEWPRSVNWMRDLSHQLHESASDESARKPISLNFFAVVLRNLFFLVVVLLHGLRRLFPPY